MRDGVVTCVECGRAVPVEESRVMFPPAAARLTLKELCTDAGCPCRWPRYVFYTRMIGGAE